MNAFNQTNPAGMAARSAARRHFLRNCGLGMGQMALASLLAGHPTGAVAAEGVRRNPTAAKPPHFAPQAKRVIFLFMGGAPSQLELFDYKPKLSEFEGQSIPPSVIQGQRYAFIQPDAAVMGPRFGFAKHGQAGAELSEVLPHLAKIADKIAIVRSLRTDQFNHAPAQLSMNTGSAIPGRPSMGSWLSYGLGSVADDLPSFVVLNTGGNLSAGISLWSSGFLPSIHQGVPFRRQGDPILHLSNPPGYDRQAQRASLDLIRHFNESQFDIAGDPEITTRVNAYEMAFRMQSRAPELMDFTDEKQSTLEMYGAKPGDGGAVYANSCLLARRLVERGVRFVQLYREGWDHHSDVAGGVRGSAQAVDQASAALIEDLDQRGLLEDTLVIWGGEFGRTPMIEASGALGRSQGRDHHPRAFSMWLAGGGIRPGITYGQTDDFGFDVTENPVHIQDLQATILHCLGIDHERLTYNFRGLDFRLTGVEEHHPVQGLLA